MLKVIYASTEKDVKKNDMVQWRKVDFLVYKIEFGARPGSAVITLLPNEGGHPICLLPGDIGMKVIDQQ